MTQTLTTKPDIKYTITIYRDRAKKMKQVRLNDEIIMEGNYWDFHPGCHGIHKYGHFESAGELASRIYSWLLKNKKAEYNQVATQIREYDYE